MKPPKLALITDFTEADWVRTSLSQAAERDERFLADVIPMSFEAYVSVRHQPKKSKNNFGESLCFEKLTLLLMDHTETEEECFAAIWYGFGWSFEEEYPHLFHNMEKHFLRKFVGNREFNKFFQIPNRDYYLLKSSLLDTLKIGEIVDNYLYYEPTNMLWPKDRRWFVANEIDFHVTLIGGSKALIDEIDSNHHFITERFTPGIWSDIYLSGY
ncbi:MAG: hypothetical protein FGM49_03810 [Candidatus Nanopelagicaceae bacterium]|nr:hypothetical protein [Candidatus Nanopelagicaceae bacterium]